MKRILKGYIIPLVISVLFGFVSAKLVYGVYNDSVKMATELIKEKHLENQMI